jgi:hypothetical protein
MGKGVRREVMGMGMGVGMQAVVKTREMKRHGYLHLASS